MIHDNNDFTAKELTWYHELRDGIPGAKNVKSETEADVLCGNHGDRHPSLGFDLAKNGNGAMVLVRCRSQGCPFDQAIAALGFDSRDLFFNSRSRKRHEEGALPGCTLEQYAAAKNLPRDFLEGGEIGLEDSTYYCKVTGKKVPAVEIPYADADGEVLATRYRTGLEKAKEGPDTRFRWAKGSHPTLYGLHRLEEATSADYVLLVEGESDCHTLWYHGRPAVGVPGVENWKDTWAELLEEVPRILVCVEPDAAGEMLWGKVSACNELRDRVVKAVVDHAV